MKGADEYAKIFGREQCGRLFLYPSSHARGNTFQIWVLPKGAKVIDEQPWRFKDSVEVYGVIAGNPGWTEVYGWLRQGKWQQDFYDLVEKRKKQIKLKAEELHQQKIEGEQQEESRIAELLESY